MRLGIPASLRWPGDTSQCHAMGSVRVRWAGQRGISGAAFRTGQWHTPQGMPYWQNSSAEVWFNFFPRIFFCLQRCLLTQRRFFMVHPVVLGARRAHEMAVCAAHTHISYGILVMAY